MCSKPSELCCGPSCVLWKFLEEKAEATTLGSRIGVGGERAGGPLSPNGGEKGLGLVTAP